MRYCSEAPFCFWMIHLSALKQTPMMQSGSDGMAQPIDAGMWGYQPSCSNLGNLKSYHHLMAPFCLQIGQISFASIRLLKVAE